MIFGIWPGVVAADLVDFRPLDCPPEDPVATLAAFESSKATHPGSMCAATRHFGAGVGQWSGVARTPPPSLSCTRATAV